MFHAYLIEKTNTIKRRFSNNVENHKYTKELFMKKHSKIDTHKKRYYVETYADKRFQNMTLDLQRN